VDRGQEVPAGRHRHVGTGQLEDENRYLVINSRSFPDFYSYFPAGIYLLKRGELRGIVAKRMYGN
jgi:hypothetical protein